MTATGTRDATGRQLTTPHKVMIAGFVVLALVLLVVVQAVLYRAWDPVALIGAPILLVGAGLVATGRFWGLVGATVVAALMFLFDGPMLVSRLLDPTSAGWAVVSVIGLACYVSILVAAVTAIRAHRSLS